MTNKFICILDYGSGNVRSVHNVGSIFRSADGFGAEKIYLTGYTACPPREDLHKTALGAEEAVPWVHFENSTDAVSYNQTLIEHQKINKELNKSNFRIMSISVSNFKEFYKNKDIEGYSNFFNNNYLQ